MKTYQFDVKLWAVIDIRAEDERSARTALEDVLRDIDLPTLENFDDATLVSLSDEGSHDLIEITGGDLDE